MKRLLQCAEQNHSPTSPNIALATKKTFMLNSILLTHETSSTMHGVKAVSLQHQQLLRLRRNSNFHHKPKTPWYWSHQWKTHSSMIRAWSTSPNTALQWHSSFLLLTHERSITMRGATEVITGTATAILLYSSLLYAAFLFSSLLDSSLHYSLLPCPNFVYRKYCN